jgi:hypothetical protein
MMLHGESNIFLRFEIAFDDPCFIILLSNAIYLQLKRLIFAFSLLMLDYALDYF